MSKEHFTLIKMNMARKKPTLAEFKREYPREYAELSEILGYKEEALKCYANSFEPEKIMRAAKLAIGLTKYELARGLLKKAKKLAEDNLASAEESVADSQRMEGSGLMGSAMGYWSAENTVERIRMEVSKLEAELARK
jgi:hypothetical protein